MLEYPAKFELRVRAWRHKPAFQGNRHAWMPSTPSGNFVLAVRLGSGHKNC